MVVAAMTCTLFTCFTSFSLSLSVDLCHLRDYTQRLAPTPISGPLNLRNKTYFSNQKQQWKKWKKIKWMLQFGITCEKNKRPRVVCGGEGRLIFKPNRLKMTNEIEIWDPWIMLPHHFAVNSHKLPNNSLFGLSLSLSLSLSDYESVNHVSLHPNNSFIEVCNKKKSRNKLVRFCAILQLSLVSSPSRTKKPHTHTEISWN